MRLLMLDLIYGIFMYFKANSGLVKLRWRNGSASVFGTEGWEFDPPTE